jgi:hypothetical protein
MALASPLVLISPFGECEFPFLMSRLFPGQKSIEKNNTNYEKQEIYFMLIHFI